MKYNIKYFINTTVNWKMNKVFRYYQQECDDGIYEELHNNNKCLVKMLIPIFLELKTNQIWIAPSNHKPLTKHLIRNLAYSVNRMTKINLINLISKTQAQTYSIKISSHLYKEITINWIKNRKI
jgi:hypothetical protein